MREPHDKLIPILDSGRYEEMTRQAQVLRGWTLRACLVFRIPPQVRRIDALPRLQSPLLRAVFLHSTSNAKPRFRPWRELRRLQTPPQSSLPPTRHPRSRDNRSRDLKKDEPWHRRRFQMHRAGFAIGGSAHHELYRSSGASESRLWMTPLNARYLRSVRTLGNPTEPPPKLRRSYQ